MHAHILKKAKSYCHSSRTGVHIDTTLPDFYLQQSPNRETRRKNTLYHACMVSDTPHTAIFYSKITYHAIKQPILEHDHTTGNSEQGAGSSRREGKQSQQREQSAAVAGSLARMHASRPCLCKMPSHSDAACRPVSRHVACLVGHKPTSNPKHRGLQPPFHL